MSENQPIIRLYFVKMKEAFEKLSDKEKLVFMRKDRENLDELGMKALSMINCTWSSGEWAYVGVEQWPSMEAIEKREKFKRTGLDVSHYVEFKTILGTPESFDDYGKM